MKLVQPDIDAGDSFLWNLCWVGIAVGRQAFNWITCGSGSIGSFWICHEGQLNLFAPRCGPLPLLPTNHFVCDPPNEVSSPFTRVVCPYRASLVWKDSSHWIHALSGYPACNAKQEIVNIVNQKILAMGKTTY